MCQQAEKKTETVNRTWQKNKTGGSKMESDDSPEIPDRGETSDIPRFPLEVPVLPIPSFCWSLSSSDATQDW